jgi:excisionase family DNA binding protein
LETSPEVNVTPIPEKVPLSERRTLCVNEACDYASIGKTLLYEMIRSGRIAGMTLGKRRLILRESLDKLLTPDR